MPLKIFTICDPDFGEKAYQKWIQDNPGIKIQTKHICAHTEQPTNKYPSLQGSFDRLYIFYDSPGDAQYSRDRNFLEQNSQFEMCRDIAKALKDDKFYHKLTNKIQRHLYLLDVHNIPKEDAEVVDTIIQMNKKGALKL